MHTNVNLQADTTRKPTPKTPASIWFGGVAVRTIFLIVLTVLTARVASPQIENIWSVFETPGDLIRVGIGFRGLRVVHHQPFHFAQRPGRLPNLAVSWSGHFAPVAALRHRRLVNLHSDWPLLSSLSSLRTPEHLGAVDARALTVLTAASSIPDQDRKLRYCGLEVATGTGASPIAHSRQTGVVQPTGQPPPSAMNNAAVSERRLASVCTRFIAAVR